MTLPNPGRKPRVAVHKFSSCDGCQLALLGLGEDLLQLSTLVEFVHFAEAGPVDPGAEVDIAFVEGSIGTAADMERIREVRATSRFLVAIGACATSGGLQALRNLAGGQAWTRAVYPRPDYVDCLATSTAVSRHVQVDLELWGCPVSSRQVTVALRALLSGVQPVEERDKVCMECKRSQVVCVMVARGLPCMGPVTRAGCGALCPSIGRDCYACYGPAENANAEALARRMEASGIPSAAVGRRFLSINSASPPFFAAGIGRMDSHD